MMSDKSKDKVSRRGFLKGAAVAAPAIAAGGLLNAGPQSPSIPKKWDRETDVVVVGSGFAGLSTAITVKDAGAKTVILEKMPQKYEGGNSRVSGNMWWTPTNLPEALQYMEALSNGLADKESIRALAEEMLKLNEWLEKLGVKASRLVSMPVCAASLRNPVRKAG